MKAEHSSQKPDDLQPVMDTLQHSPLRSIVQKARFLLALDREIQQCVQSGFGPYCHVMNVQQNTVILGVSNAAIATRIQMTASDIVCKLQKIPAFQHIQKIQCKVCAENLRY
ncbi:MAG: hypothetical protein A3J38_08240 [Gammaproteobacteria bacterium RIFCSPHIGHO2_12_FULL_45_9]|nr:MAG: hypothetical protein A3J38_08240 [Gammaproteobacteria bacterium RIFCSPHIGHO2_12_FULL_45_9]